MRFELEYWKTDRNGTKYYLDWNCPRCAGYGEAEKWVFTGKVCYACGGTGKRTKAKIEKVYTREHEAKLEAKRLAKAKAVEAEQERKVEETRRGTLKREGFAENGEGFAHYGETYRNRDALKAAGGKWCQMMTAYIAPHRIELDGVKIVPVTANAICYPDGRIDTEKAWDFARNLK